MSEEDTAEAGEKPKKRKIDLKERLSSVRATGSMAAIARSGSDDPLSFPPPPSGHVPPPKVLSATAATFVPSVSSAFAPPPEEKPAAPVQPQTIKVEVGEEVEQERTKTAKKYRVFVLLAAVAFGGLGFMLGGVRERGVQGKQAQQGANALAADVSGANETMKDLSHEIAKAAERLQSEDYPEDLIAFLNRTNVDFDVDKFKGRSIGALPQDLLRDLLLYSQGISELNTKRTSLKNLLGLAKEPTLKYFKERKDPVVNFSVLLDKRGDDYFALLVPNKEPFKQKEKAPEKYKVTRPPQGQEKEGKEVEGARLASSTKLDSGVLVPVDENTVAAFSSRERVVRLIGALNETRALIEGSESPIPDQSTEGLVKAGERIHGQLKKIGAL